MKIDKFGNQKVEAGDCFECEGFYYIIVQGSITYNSAGYLLWYYFKRSPNLRVQQLKWVFDSWDIQPINEFKEKKFVEFDKYRLEPTGSPHKLVTMKRNFTIEPFKMENASWVVAYTNIEEREKNKTNPKYSRKYFNH